MVLALALGYEPLAHTKALGLDLDGAGLVNITVCLFVCSLACRITKKLLNRFSTEFGGKGCAWAVKETVTFYGNPDDVTLEVGLE